MAKRCFIKACPGARVGRERGAGRVVRGPLTGEVSLSVEGVGGCGWVTCDDRGDLARLWTTSFGLCSEASAGVSFRDAFKRG